MAYTKKTTVKSKTSDVKKTAKVATKTVKLDDSVLVTVKSNCYGELIYINHKTGDKTVWDNFGDTQDVTMGDLRSMKGAQRAFYENNWIYIVSVADEGYEDVTPESVYKTLGVTQYYKDILSLENVNSVFNWKPDDIKSKIPMMSSGLKTSIVVAANELIEQGVLESMSKVKALEEALGCKLKSIND